MGQDPSGQPTRTIRTSTASVFGPVVNSNDTCCQSFVPVGTGCEEASTSDSLAAFVTVVRSVAALFRESVRTK
jgi:hypothetical protein